MEEFLFTTTEGISSQSEPHRGERNSSRNLPFVVNKIAEIKGVAPQEVEEVTWENGFRLYPKVRR